MTTPDIRRPLSSRAWLALTLAVLTVLSFLLRVLPSHGKVFQGDWVEFKGYDAWYHVRLIENLVQHFPERLTFDPYTFFPNGQDVFFAPLYDLIVGFSAWLIGAGSPSTELTQNVAAYFPAVLGALVTIPVYFLGKALFNSRIAGLIAAALVIVLPGQFLLRSSLGFTDHHVVETLFSSVALLLLLLAVKTARERGLSFSTVAARDWAQLRRPLVYSLLGGIALGCYLLSWVGGALVVFIIFLFAFLQFTSDHLRGRPTDYLCVVGVPCLAIALLVLAPFWGQYKYSAVQTMSLVIGALAFAGLSVLSMAMRRWTIPRVVYPLAVLVLTVAALAVFRVVAPDRLSGMLGELAWLNPSALQLTIGELQPLNLSTAWEEFTTAFYLSLISLVLVAYFVIKEGKAEKTLLLVWSAIMLAATVSENRFAYYFAVNVSLLTGFLAWRAWTLAAARLIPRLPGGSAVGAAEAVAAAKHTVKTGKRSKRKKARRERAGAGTLIAGYRPGMIGYGLVATVVLFFLVFYPNIGTAIDVSGQAVSQVGIWRDPLLWMKNTDNTQDPFGNPDFFNQVYEEPPGREPYDYPDSAYGIMAWWDYGHWITQIAHRIPNANPHQQGASDAAWYFTAQDEQSANAILDKLGSRYVALDLWMALHEINPSRNEYGNLHAVLEWSGMEEEDFFELYYQRTEDGKLEPVILYNPEYYRSMSTRLFVFEGQAVVPADSTYVISFEDKRAAGGEPYKEITSIRQFPTYERAVSFLEENPDLGYLLVGYSQLRSAVPLERLEHYELVYESAPPTPEPGQVALSEVKIFEYTP